jgi:hypothetical protein
VVNDYKDIIVSTGDIKKDYDIIGPVYVKLSNRGSFGGWRNELDKLKKKYFGELEEMKKEGHLGKDKMDWNFLMGEWSAGQDDFDKCFFISTEELKKRASIVEADAIIFMRQDIDLDTTAFQFFYMQMYGTAVKFRKKSA